METEIENVNGNVKEKVKSSSPPEHGKMERKCALIHEQENTE